MVLSPNTDNIATGGGIVKNAGATSSGHSVKDITIRGANQQSVYWGDADGFIELEGIESWKSNGDGIVIDAAANGQLRGCVSQADDGDGIKVTTTGHGMRLQENQVRNPGGGYVKLADFAVSHGNWPAQRGDVRTIKTRTKAIKRPTTAPVETRTARPGTTELTG